MSLGSLSSPTWGLRRRFKHLFHLHRLPAVWLNTHMLWIHIGFWHLLSAPCIFMNNTGCKLALAQVSRDLTPVLGEILVGLHKKGFYPTVEPHTERLQRCSPQGCLASARKPSASGELFIWPPPSQLCIPQQASSQIRTLQARSHPTKLSAQLYQLLHGNQLHEIIKQLLP